MFLGVEIRLASGLDSKLWSARVTFSVPLDSNASCVMHVAANLISCSVTILLFENFGQLTRREA